MKLHLNYIKTPAKLAMDATIVIIMVTVLFICFFLSVFVVS